MGFFDKKAPAPQGPQAKKGTIDSVPCPHCNAPNDFRELEAHQIDTGDKVACDHCNKVMEIAGKQTVTVIHVRPTHEIARREAGPRQAATISAGQARKMLGRG